MVKSIYDVSFFLFGKIESIFDSFFKPLKKKLLTASIDINYKKYGAFVIFIFVFSFLILLFLSSILTLILVDNLLISGPIVLIVSLTISSGITLFIFYYPFFVSDEKKARIENNLPFICLYLSTIAKSGFPPQEMFKMLAKFKNYDVISNEAQKITADIDILGFDFPTAINRAIKRSPSYNWIELLSGIRNTITIGGELGDYLEEKAEGYIQDYKRKVKKFNDTVSIFMNVYITLILVGIVFFIIMSSLMSTIGGMSINMLKMSQIGIVFVGLPVVSLAFILLIKTMSPWTK